MGNLLVGVIVAPLAGSVVALFGKILPWKTTASVVASATVLANAAFLVMLLPTIRAGGTVRYDMGGFPAPFGITLALDGTALLASALIVVIAVAALLASFGHHRDDPRYYFFLLLLIAGMQGVVVTTDLFNMFVAFEIVAIAAYVLIAYERTTTSLVASVKYLILSTVGILFFLLGVLLVYRDLGTLSLADVALVLADDASLRDSPNVHLAVAAFCVGIGVRTAFIPFHTWLPEAHAYAPHPVSAMLSGVLIKVSFLAMVRLLIAFQAAYLNELLLWIGAVTAVVAVVWALSQSDAKRLLAYHSISQMGYILAAYGIGDAAGELAALSHAVNHALFKSLLFLTVGTAVDIGGSRDIYEIPPLGRRAPLIAIAFGFGALSIAGVPLFNGYASKQLISSALSGRAAYLLLQITAVGTVASFIKLSRIFSFRRSEASVSAPRRCPVSVSVSAVILAALCALTGLFPRVTAQTYSTLLRNDAYLPSFFAGGKLLQTLIVIALGAGLYFLVTSKPVGSVTSRIKALAPDTETVLVFFFIGLAIFASVAYFSG